MIYQHIQGAKVPALGYGTWQIEGDTCREGVEHALAIGYRHIDTAQGYENEDQVGTGINNSGVPRDQIWLTSKLRPDWFDADTARKRTEESLSKLQTDYLDLFLLHWPNDEVPLEETLGVMREFQDAGRIRHVGISNFTPTQMRKANDILRVFTNQVEYHPYLHQRFVRETAKDLGMLVTAYSPIAQGAVLDDPTLNEIGAAHGKSAVQVTLRWLIQQDDVAAIPKAASASHRESNFDIFDFELSDDEMKAVHALEREQRLIESPYSPAWERG